VPATLARFGTIGKKNGTIIPQSCQTPFAVMNQYHLVRIGHAMVILRLGRQDYKYFSNTPRY
jgi:hypothetical protein